MRENVGHRLGQHDFETGAHATRMRWLKSPPRNARATLCIHDAYCVGQASAAFNVLHGLYARVHTTQIGEPGGAGVNIHNRSWIGTGIS